MLNLAGNAIKFTEKGNVTIHADLKKSSETHVKVEFRVTDTGPGIAAAKLDRLFKSFSQLEDSTNWSHGGTGLGLVISKSIAELMGGSIGVVTKEKKGSTFWFTAFFEKDVSLPETKFKLSKELASKKILVIEDKKPHLQIISELLKTFKLSYDKSETEQEAMNKLQSAKANNSPYNIIIIDYHLQENNGKRLGQRIKSSADFKNLDIIMLINKGERTNGETLQENGFSAYLTKPLKHDLFFDCLTELSTPLSSTMKKPKSPIVTNHCATETKAQNISILLVEDNRVNQMVTQTILTKNGYRVTIANNGNEAICALEKNDFDLVLMDILMPEMGGYEATRKIRSNETTVINRHLPIIALTASALAEDKEKCLSAGMNDYIAKPVKPQDLIDKVKKWSWKNKR